MGRGRSFWFTYGGRRNSAQELARKATAAYIEDVSNFVEQERLSVCAPTPKTATLLTTAAFSEDVTAS